MDGRPLPSQGWSEISVTLALHCQLDPEVTKRAGDLEDRPDYSMSSLSQNLRQPPDIAGKKCISLFSWTFSNIPRLAVSPSMMTAIPGMMSSS